ncbi:MAG: hypothetical protein DSY80_09170 [Desulfocapsa sp.]|nr:MAG: hypothetical protein DSY80_09170 [Desulfocapsa sp.]
MGLLTISNEIMAEMEEGLSREEIFQKHVESNPSGAAKYAYCIASIPASALRKQYLISNGLLMVLLVLYAVITVLAELPIDLNEPTIFILIKTLLPLIFSYFVFRFHGGIYRLTGLWCSYDLLESILLSGVGTITDGIRLLILFAIVFLAFTIARKVFPHLKVVGPKQDSTGKFFL